MVDRLHDSRRRVFGHRNTFFRRPARGFGKHFDTDAVRRRRYPFSVDADTAPKTSAHAAFAAATVSAAAFAAFILGAHLQPDLGPRFELSVADFANWNVATFATAIVGGLAIGRIARRLGTRVALGAVLFVATVGMLLIASADSATAAFVGRLAAAFAFGGTWGTTQSVASAAASADARARAAGIVQTGPPAGSALAAAINAWIGPASTSVSGIEAFRGSALGVAALCVVATAALFLIPRTIPTSTPAASVATGTGFNRRGLIVGGVALALQMAAYWCSFAWLPQHLAIERGLPRTETGTLLVVVALFQILGDVLGGRAVARYGTRAVFTTGSLAVAAGLSMTAFAWPILASTVGGVGAALAATGLGMGLWAAFAPMFAQHIPESNRAAGLSTVYNVARLVQIPAQVVLAAMYARTGSLASALGLSAACCALSIIPFTIAAARHDDAVDRGDRI